MKIVFGGKIGDITKSEAIDNTISIEIDMVGHVDGRVGLARETKLVGKLALKPVVANELKIGTKLRIIVEQDDPTE